MNYYKVVDRPLTREIIIDTTKTNYSTTLCNFDYYKHLVVLLSLFSKETNLPLDFYCIVNDNLTLWGDTYFNQFPKTNSNCYELYQLTMKDHHKNLFIPKETLIAFIEKLVENELELFNEGNYLWEYIFEQVRKEKYNYIPSRWTSFFLFDNREACNYYIENHKHGGIICQVELLETQQMFKGDMRLFDEVPNYYNYNQTTESAKNYWSGDTSKQPIFETLFKGRCRLFSPGCAY